MSHARERLHPEPPYVDDLTHPGSIAACCLLLPRSRRGTKDRTVRVPEIDQPGRRERLLVVIEERSETRHALGKQSSTEERARALLADLKNEARRAVVQNALRIRFERGQMERERGRVCGEAGMALHLVEDLERADRQRSGLEGGAGAEEDREEAALGLVDCPVQGRLSIAIIRVYIGAVSEEH